MRLLLVGVPLFFLVRRWFCGVPQSLLEPLLPVEDVETKALQTLTNGVRRDAVPYLCHIRRGS